MGPVRLRWSVLAHLSHPLGAGTGDSGFLVVQRLCVGFFGGGAYNLGILLCAPRIFPDAALSTRVETLSASITGISVSPFPSHPRKEVTDAGRGCSSLPLARRRLSGVLYIIKLCIAPSRAAGLNCMERITTRISPRVRISVPPARIKPRLFGQRSRV